MSRRSSETADMVTRFWFAWTGEYNSIHWIACTLAGVFLATSILLIFVGYLNYLTDSYLMYAASAIAANTVARSAAGAAAPLFTDYMFKALGVGGGGSLIAGVGCLLAPIPFIFYRYGRPIRERSKFAPTGHQKPQQEHQKNDEEAAPEHMSTSDEEEAELDEEAGLPDQKETEEIEKQRSGEDITPSSNHEHDGDRFLDASGMEKAEQKPVS